MRGSSLPISALRIQRGHRRPGVTGAWSGSAAWLAGAGLLLELLLVLGFLLPYSILRHPDVIAAPDPLVVVLGNSAGAALRFIVPVLLAFAALGLALLAAPRATSRRAALLLLGGTAIFSATLLPMSPVGANDVYHNVADARTLFIYQDNPTLVPPIAHADDPFYRYVASWQDTPSAYGPVWYAISGIPLLVAGDSLWPNVLGQKLITAAFLLGCTLLAMLLAERIRPGTGLMAGLLVGWNPLLQFETAGNAHNDVVMAFFALAALYALSRRWWPAVFPALALAIASKPMLAVLGPVLLAWMVRRPEVSRRQLLLSLGLGALTLAAVYVPLFAGRDTLDGLQREANHVTSSPGAMTYTLLQSHFQMDWSSLLARMKLVAWPLFLLGYGIVLWRMIRRPDLDALAGAAAWAVFLLMTIIVWWFMSWYLFWLVPFAALRPRSRASAVALVFSLCALLMYVPHQWLLAGNPTLMETATALTGFLLPLLFAVAPRRSRVKSMPAASLAAAD